MRNDEEKCKLQVFLFGCLAERAASGLADAASLVDVNLRKKWTWFLDWSAAGPRLLFLLDGCLVREDDDGDAFEGVHSEHVRRARDEVVGLHRRQHALGRKVPHPRQRKGGRKLVNSHVTVCGI